MSSSTTWLHKPSCSIQWQSIKKKKANKQTTSAFPIDLPNIIMWIGERERSEEEHISIEVWCHHNYYM